MRYFVTLDGQTIEVDLRADGIVVDGETVPAELSAIAGTPIRRLSLGPRSHVLHVGPLNGKGVWEFHLDGERYSAEVVDERTRAIRAMTGSNAAAQGPKPVRAPMPGMVLRVEVKPGDHVAAGQGVVIVEAMKMENELKAEASGIVKKVLTEAGATVEKGAVLIEFETPKAGDGAVAGTANG
jgi:biotin carboxyl carrier protein